MRAWRWTIRLTEQGHRFKGGEWRCVDCRRTAFDLLEEPQPCMSPSAEGEYLFIGGPLDGEWMKLDVPRPVWHVAIPRPLDLHVVTEDEEPETIDYRLKRKDGKPILAYIFEG